MTLLFCFNVEGGLDQRFGVAHNNIAQRGSRFICWDLAEELTTLSLLLVVLEEGPRLFGIFVQT